MQPLLRLVRIFRKAARVNLLDLARSAIAAEKPRYATASQTAELRRLLDVILADCPGEIEWSLGVAVNDPDDALLSFRALAAEIHARRSASNQELPSDGQ